MKRLTTIFILAICFGASANDISKINKLKKNAEIAFEHQQFDVAVSNYSYLLDTLQIYDEESIMNLGHAYYQLNQKDLAQAQYQKLVLSKNEGLKSVAYQQLGAMSNDPKTMEKAMSYFKESIKSDPGNLDARYNYELVKKRLKEQQDQNQDQKNDDQNNENQENKDEEKKDQENKENEDQQEGDQNKDQEKQDSEDQEQQNQENKEQEGENKDDQQQEGQDEKKEGEEEKQPEPKEGEEGEQNEKDKQQQPPSPSDKMQEMNISEEKAKMILEALKNSEIQYIQQNRRKPTKRKESDKPDW
ncbi:Tetratricopeptide repeat [Reichenbachiella faecimaris]|uniref:Tetratricopeptide repeat n=1 Tax=Reichenbachiella faecimaris TaxID=692418 RepID=A0A1W2GNX4_REIFA|nr:hypothetical protein [Reichenbachiella faecimaris]SMD38355.1 Tetratricopeptide repeat [Reichenbachiella faecimaris]